MTFDSLLTALQDYDVMLPLLCSLAAGASIGIERELNRKPAGIRTHALLCFAAAMMTLLGLRLNEWYANLPEGMTMVTDMARMPHAILTGVGFLGAGVIFREGASVRGLTTAASLWLTAALGIVFGTGMIELGVIGTFCAVIVLVLLRISQRFAPPAPFARLKLEVEPGTAMNAERLKEILAGQGLGCGPIGYRLDGASGLRRYEAMITKRKPVSFPQGLVDLLGQTEGVREVSLTPALLDRHR